MLFIKWVDRLNQALKILLGIAMGLMSLLVLTQVTIRSFLTKFGIYISLPWTEELARILMIWSVFIGGALAVRRAELLAVDALVHGLSPIYGKGIKLTAHLISLVFYVYILIIGVSWAKYGLTGTSPVLGISMIYTYISMAIGAALMIVNTTVLLLDTFLQKKDIRNPVI